MPDSIVMIMRHWASAGWPFIDLAGGHQPLSNENGTIWTVFNGEIYNFPALRRRLEAKGHHLRSIWRYRGPRSPL